MKFREISQEELDDILEKHKKWLTFQRDGECADLANADLTNANLRYAKIWDTNFFNVIGETIISIQLNTSVENRVINYIPEIDWVSAGCFHGTLEDLENAVKITHKDNEKTRKRYEKTIEFIKFLEKDYKND